MDDKTLTHHSGGAQNVSPSSDAYDLSGTTLGGYKLLRKIAQGGMGVIYEATQIRLERKVALKILTEQLATRPEFLQRFEREAKAAAALNHPNIVQVHDFGEANGRHFIIMEFIDGENLSAYIERRGKIPVENALAIIEQAAQALKAAAAKSIIHRDIKPSNLMLTRDGRVKVADMGLAKILTEDSELTMSSVSLGSPHFIAPEQVDDSKNADHRVDIYSLGITLLYLLTGKHAYDGNSPISIVFAHTRKPLPSGAELGTELPPEIEAFVRRMAAKDPAERYQDYDSLIADLHRVRQGSKPLAEPPVEPLTPPLSARTPSQMKWIAGISVLAIVLVAIVAVFVLSKKKPAPIPSVASNSASIPETPVRPSVENQPPRPPQEDFGNQPPPGQQPDNLRGSPLPLITALDTVHDRVIDEKEIANASASLRTLDKNGDGVLTADEYAPQIPVGGMKPPIVRILDANGDGVIDKTEIANASAALKKLDVNGDGKLTQDEFAGRPPQRPDGVGNDNLPVPSPSQQ